MKKQILWLVLAISLIASGHSIARAEDGDWPASSEQKIQGLATIWAEAKYAFPSFSNVPDLDWDQAFQDFIPRVMQAESQDEYYGALMEFAGLLRDGHTSVLPPWGYLRPDYDNPPLEVEIIQDTFVVVRCARTPELVEAGIQPGVEILQIEGMPAREYLEEKVNRFYPRGSAHADEATNMVYLLRGPKGSRVSLEIRDTEGKVRPAELTRDWMTSDTGPFFPRILLSLMADPGMEVQRREDGVIHLTIGHFENPAMADAFLALIDEIAGKSDAALLIDMRFCMGGKSSIAEKMIGALIDEPVSSPQWKYPRYCAAERNWGHPPEWEIQSKMIAPREGSRFMGPLVILTGGVTSSTAEDFAISLREAGRAKLVGAFTAGSAGNPIDRPLPGGGTFRMATFRALLPDGSEYVGKGVQPDVLSYATIEDIRQGNDPALQKGFQLLLE